MALEGGVFQRKQFDLPRAVPGGLVALEDRAVGQVAKIDVTFDKLRSTWSASRDEVCKDGSERGRLGGVRYDSLLYRPLETGDEHTVAVAKIGTARIGLCAFGDTCFRSLESLAVFCVSRPLFPRATFFFVEITTGDIVDAKGFVSVEPIFLAEAVEEPLPLLKQYADRVDGLLAAVVHRVGDARPHGSA